MAIFNTSLQRDLVGRFIAPVTIPDNIRFASKGTAVKYGIVHSCRNDLLKLPCSKTFIVDYFCFPMTIFDSFESRVLVERFYTAITIPDNGIRFGSKGAGEDSDILIGVNRTIN